MLPGFDAIRLPGEQRRTRRAERAANGVPVFPEVVEQLDKLAGELKTRDAGSRSPASEYAGPDFIGAIASRTARQVAAGVL